MTLRAAHHAGQSHNHGSHASRIWLAAMTSSLVLGMTGCVPVAPAPTPAPTAATSAAPTPESIDPRVMPSDRYGIDCGSLLAPADLEPIYGAELPLDASDKHNGALIEELVQDGALQCRWGADRDWDESVASLTVIAAPYGRAALDLAVASFTPIPGGPGVHPMPGVGDAAWSQCAADLSSLNCSWVVAIGATWLVVSLGGALESEADVTSPQEYVYDAVPRPDSPGAILVGRIAGALGAAQVKDVPPPTVTVRDCDALADWEGISAEFALGAPQASVPQNSGSSRFSDSVTASLRDVAAQNRGARVCHVDFASSSDIPVSLWVRVIPDAGWIGGMSPWAGGAGVDEWGGWGGEECHGGEGGYRCEVSGFVNGRAAFVSIFGEAPEGMATRVFDLATAP